MKKNKLFPIILTTVLMSTPFTALAATEKLSVDKETADYVTVNSDGSQYFVFAVKKDITSTEDQTQNEITLQNDVATQINQQTATQSAQSSDASNTQSSSSSGSQQSAQNANQNTQSADEVFEEMAAAMDSYMQEYQNQASQQTQLASEQPAEQPASESNVYWTTGDGYTFDNEQDAGDWALFNDTNYVGHG